MVAVRQKLFVYSRALDALTACEEIARRVPAYRSDIIDQLRRASVSITANLAEGAGEFSPADKAKYYRIARRSASECGALLDAIERVIPDPPDTTKAHALLNEVVALSTNVVLAIEARGRDRRH